MPLANFNIVIKFPRNMVGISGIICTGNAVVEAQPYISMESPTRPVRYYHSKGIKRLDLKMRSQNRNPKSIFSPYITSKLKFWSSQLASCDFALVTVSA